MHKLQTLKVPKDVSPVFGFLSLVHEGTLNILPNMKRNMQKTRTSEEKGSKPFFLVTLPKTQTSINLDGENYLIRENHISIYEHYEDNEEKIFGMTAYHYTATLHKSGSRAILHTFYDMYGVYKGYNIVLSVADEKSSVTLENELPLKILSGMHIHPVINEINDALDIHIRGQEKEIDKLSKAVCNKSRAIFKPDREPLLEGEHFKEYVRLVMNYAQKVEELNRLIFSPNFALPKLLRETISSLMAKKIRKAQTPEPKTTVVKILEKPKKEKEELMASTEVDEVLDSGSESVITVPEVKSLATGGEVNKKQLAKTKKKKKKKKVKKIGGFLTDFIQSGLKELEGLRDKEKESDPQSLLRRHTLIYECIALLESRHIVLILELSSEKEQLVLHAQNLIDEFCTQDKLEEIKILVKVAKEVSAKSIIRSALSGQYQNLAFLLSVYRRSIDLHHHNMPLLCDRNLPVESMRILLERGANPNTVSFLALTPLIVASDEGDVKKIDILLKHGASINYQQRKPSFVVWQLDNNPVANQYAASLKKFSEEPDSLLSALFFAVSQGKIEPVQQLVEAGADLELLNRSGFSAYSCASVLSTEKPPLNDELKKILRYFYKDAQCDINKLFGRPRMRSTVLHFAVQFRRPDYVAYLLELDADPNVIRDKDEREAYYFTPLNFSIVREFYEIVEIILAQARVPLSFSNLLLSYSLCKNKETKELLFNSLIKHLIAFSKEGLNTSITIDVFSQSLLHWMINFDALEDIQNCLNRGADPNKTRADGVSCLGLAIGMGSVEVVELILNNEGNPITLQTLVDSRKYTCPKNKVEINALLDAYENKLLVQELVKTF